MAKLKPEWSWDSRLPMDILEPVMGMALGKPLVALVGLSHRPPQLGLGVTREAESQQTGNSYREGSLPFGWGSIHTAGVPALGASDVGLAPLAALIQGILSQTPSRPLSTCGQPIPQGRLVGGENPHKPASPWQGRKAENAGWDCSPKNLLFSQETRLSKARICLGWSQRLLTDLLGQCPELSGELVFYLGANKSPLMRSLCQQLEPGSSHCQPAAKAQGCIPLQLGSLLAPQNILEEAGEGVPAPPLCQPSLFKGYLPQVLPDYRERVRRGWMGGAYRDQSWENHPPPFLLHSGRAGGHVKHSQATHLPAPQASGLLLTCSSKPL